MNRRDFLKTIPRAAALTSTLTAKTQDSLPDDSKHAYLDYYVNCYVQNQQYWPLEIYKDGDFKNGKLYFSNFKACLEFIKYHSLVTPFYNEALYEVFHEKSKSLDIPPKHIYNYWVKVKDGDLPDEIEWTHPDYK